MSTASPQKLACCWWHTSAKALVPDIHHIVPKAWGGRDVPDNKVTICPNVHRLTHNLLNKYKKNGGTPSSAELKLFSPFVRDLAKRGWEGTVLTYGQGTAWPALLPNL